VRRRRLRGLVGSRKSGQCTQRASHSGQGWCLAEEVHPEVRLRPGRQRVPEAAPSDKPTGGQAQDTGGGCVPRPAHESQANCLNPTTHRVADRSVDVPGARILKIVGPPAGPVADPPRKLAVRSGAQLEVFPVERTKHVEVSMIEGQDPVGAIAAGQHDQ
jgi:hypothetical protein